MPNFCHSIFCYKHCITSGQEKCILFPVVNGTLAKEDLILKDNDIISHKVHRYISIFNRLLKCVEKNSLMKLGSVLDMNLLLQLNQSRSSRTLKILL